MDIFQQLKFQFCTIMYTVYSIPHFSGTFNDFTWFGDS